MSQTSLLAVALLLVAAICKGQDDDYKLRYKTSKDTWSRIQSTANIKKEQEKLINGYSGYFLDYCTYQFRKRDWTADLRNKLAEIKGKINYIDKTMGERANGCPAGNQACKNEIMDEGKRDLDALEKKSITSVNAEKKTSLQKQKQYMDDCMS